MFIKSRISQQQAENIFSTKKSSLSLISKLFSRKSLIFPKRLEVLYLPFYLFDVLVEKEEKGKKDTPTSQQQVTLSVDGLLGHAVLYAEDALDVEKDPKTLAPSCDFELSSSTAAKTALDQYKGILLEHGLRTQSSQGRGDIGRKKGLFSLLGRVFQKEKRL